MPSVRGIQLIKGATTNPVRLKLAIVSLGYAALVGALYGPAKAKAASTFREFSLDYSGGYSSADLSPDGSRVAIHTFLSPEGPARDPRDFSWGIQFWDYQRPEIAATWRLPRVSQPAWDPHNPLPITEDFVRYSSDGRFLLAFDGLSRLQLFKVGEAEAHVLRTVDLGLSRKRPTFVLVDLAWSPDGKQVAALFSWKSFHEGVVRVYSVESGQILWQSSADRVEIGGAAWSPDGQRLAVTLLSGEEKTAYPPRDIENLLIVDGHSGRKIIGIRTGGAAGPVCFAPDNAVLTAPYHFRPRSRDPFHPERVKVWDATTGKLLRRISSPGRDIHNELLLSADGKVLLAFVGKEKSGFSLRGLEDVQEVIDQKFQLFEYKTGRLIATSPDLKESSMMCINHAPAFRTDERGDRILVLLR